MSRHYATVNVQLYNNLTSVGSNLTVPTKVGNLTVTVISTSPIRKRFYFLLPSVIYLLGVIFQELLIHRVLNIPFCLEFQVTYSSVTANVNVSDYQCTNGRVHIINSVLTIANDLYTWGPTSGSALPMLNCCLLILGIVLGLVGSR